MEALQLRKVSSKAFGIMEERKAKIFPNYCLTCGTCVGGCPISDVVDGLDLRKAIRMCLLGLEEEVVQSKFPWVCTICGRCQHACPMGIDISAFLRALRWMRPRDQVPSVIHKGVLMDLERGNNLGIPKEIFLEILEDEAKELENEGFPGFKVPVDKEGANILVTINSKEPFAEPEDMRFWWKIFYAAKEDWTVPSYNWEGVNWGLFSGDDESMKTLVGRIVEQMYRLKCKTLLLPE